MRLIANFRFPYRTRHLTAGEPFEADEKLGKLLVKMGRAKLAPAADIEILSPPSPQIEKFEPPPEPMEALAKMKQEPAPVFAETVVPEPPAEPAVTPQAAELPPADEPAKPAFKTRRSYSSRSL